MPTVVGSTGAITPTRNTLCEEALRRAGFPSPTAQQISRARDEWLIEIIHDIWYYAQADGNTRLKSLHRTAVTTLEKGVRRYAVPTDFDEELSIALMDGTLRYTVVSGTADTVVVPAALAESAALGHFLYVHSGTGKRQYRECKQVQADTPIAGQTTLTVDADWDTGTNPTATDSIIIIDHIYELYEIGVREADERVQQSSTSRPYEFFKYREELHMDRPPDKAYALRLRYYCNPMQLLVTDTIFTDLLKSWYSVLVKGVLKLAYQNNDDNGYDNAVKEYMEARESLVRREIDYGGQRVQFISETGWHPAGTWSD